MATLSLFEGFGVELEYMIVDRETLAVKPIADELLKAVAGEYVGDVDRDDISWSNELVLHVIELKTNGPAPELDGLAAKFQANVGDINGLLRPMGAMLLPTAAHPFMDPMRETRLWPHDYNTVYEAYNRIFDCRGHGWSNLQSTHINLPFANDEEFGRLHAAIRLVLPLLPALAASSPIVDGKLAADADARLRFYLQNSIKIPSITGGGIPEQVFTEADYRRDIFERTYRDISSYDPDSILRDEFLNSRGAIARFSRGAIEIRLLDIQEHPGADLAVVQLVVEAVRELVSEIWCSYEGQKKWHQNDLRPIFLDCIAQGDEALIRNVDYLRLFAADDLVERPAIQVWQRIAERVGLPLAESPLGVILSEGNLSTRIVHATGDEPTQATIEAVYRKLAQCLVEGRSFRA